MSEDLHIKVIYDIDDSKLNQSLSKVQSNTSKALSGGSGSGGGSGAPQTMIDRSLVQANKLQDRLSVLKDSYSKLAAQPGQERQLAKVTNELATQYGHYKNMAKTSSDYLSLLEKEVSLRKQAAQLTNTANKNDNLYSAHSQRQFAMLQQISSQVPGGGILNKFISGASRGAAGAAEGGMGGLGGGLAGGGMAAAAGAAAIAVGAVVQEMSRLASRAQELSQSASSATSSLGQLRSQTERTKIQTDASAVSSGVTVASIQQSVEQSKNSFLGGIVDFITGKSPQDKQKDVQAAISGGLGGDDKEQWRRIKEQGQDLNVDLARQRQSLDIQQQRQVRDFNLDQKQFQVDTANQKFDIQLQAQRQEQDYTLSKKQFDENEAGKLAKKEFDLSQKYAQQGFQIQQQRETQNYQIQKQRAQQDFGLQMQDRAYDYGVSKQRSQQDYTLSRQDKAYDFGVSQSRNQTEFNISQSRNMQGRQNQLMDMALGGASGLQYFQAARDFNQQQMYAKQDFERQKSYAQQDYSVSASRDARTFNLSQSRNQADFNLANQRDTRGFNLAQGRQSQDFQISQQQAIEQRGLQIESELYNRKYQGIQLELQHNRNLQDTTIALQRFAQATGFQQQRFGSQASDINVDQSLQNRDFNINAYRSLRNQGYNEQDFAGQMRDKNPLGAYGQSLTDPAFADALNRNAQATGKLPLGQQVSAATSNTDWWNVIGQAFAQSIPGLGLLSLGYQGGNALSGGGSQNQGGTVSFNPMHNVTFPTVGGASQSDFQALQQQYQRDLQALDSKYANIMNASTNSNTTWTGY